MSLSHFLMPPLFFLFSLVYILTDKNKREMVFARDRLVAESKWDCVCLCHLFFLHSALAGLRQVGLCHKVYIFFKVSFVSDKTCFIFAHTEGCSYNFFCVKKSESTVSRFQTCFGHVSEV